MKPRDPQLSKLVEMQNPQKVLDEVKTIIFMVFSRFDFEPVNRLFKDVVKLFNGEYPGYRACSTHYHDLKHTTDAMLATTRLIHGAILHGEKISQNGAKLGIISSLMHDTGYIQKRSDRLGTGGKYTLTHIERSIEFMDKYFKKNNFSENDMENCRDILHCTGFKTNIREMQFKSKETEILGKILGTADLIGQIADRTYLEKLPFLYHEFKEANVAMYSSELDLFEKTLAFYDLTQKRLASELGGVNCFNIYHFKKRWHIDRDLYADAIEKNMEYLRYILKNRQKGHRNFLRREHYPQLLEKEGL
jgi:hypothetical protein